MSESERVEAHVPITISIDVDALLKSELGWTTFNAGSYEDPDPGYMTGGNDHFIDIVANKLAAKLYDETKAIVTKAVRERAVDRVDDLLDDIMDERMMLTSTYGEPKGEPTTLREAMIKAATDRLDQPVNQDGKRIDRNSYGTSYTYIQWRAEQTARTVLDKELTGQLSDAAKKIKDHAKNIVAAKLAAVLGADL